jgi:hypothetical protein
VTDQDPDEPYAGPAAPAWVSELLAGLPADDPPIPDDVASRLDATLRELAASPPGATPEDRAGSAGSASDPGDEAGRPRPDATNVVPLAAASRHAARTNPWPHRLLLGGVAAAAVIVFGGLGTVAVLRGSGPSTSGGELATAAQGDSAASAPAAQTRFVASGAAYTADNLAATTDALLRSSRSEPQSAPTVGLATPAEGSSGSSASPPTPDRTSSGSATPDSQATTMLALKAAASRPEQTCLASLATGSGDAAPLVVDEATYDRQPAFIVVFATSDDPASVDVWVVARSCAEGSEGLYTFARVAR